MTLWSIARSPLIMGGDLRHLDDATKALLTNPEVVAVNQASSDNRPHFVQDGVRVWTAQAPNGDAYLALFNTGGKSREVGVDLVKIGLPASAAVRDLWSRAALEKASGRFSTRLPPHGSGLYRLSRA
jgi:alpha-galactosidase